MPRLNPGADTQVVATARTRLLILVGAVMIAGAAGSSLLLSGRSHTPATDTSPFPVGLTFTRGEWSTVTTKLERLGFDRATLKVVSGMRLQTPNRAFGLVRAVSTDRGVCFIPFHGVRPGTPTCSSNGNLKKPLLVFAASDRWGAGHVATDVIGIVPHSIVGVSMVDHRGIESGVALIPSGKLLSFSGGYGDSGLVVRARTASGRIAAQVKLP
jgi:hypothetical protein